MIGHTVHTFAVAVAVAGFGDLLVDSQKEIVDVAGMDPFAYHVDDSQAETADNQFVVDDDSSGSEQR